MKTRKTNEEAAAPSVKGKAKVKNLKLQKETIKDLSDRNPENVKGGTFLPCLQGTLRWCWVARAVYGEDNPRWLLFRAWLMADAPAWFRGLYLRHGERFACWLAPHDAVKSVIRLWMDWVIDRKHAGARLPALSVR